MEPCASSVTTYLYGFPSQQVGDVQGRDTVCVWTEARVEGGEPGTPCYYLLHLL